MLVGEWRGEASDGRIAPSRVVATGYGPFGGRYRPRGRFVDPFQASAGTAGSVSDMRVRTILLMLQASAFK